jgi:diguanylate cyclase (GGDEF)-like protein/PAS domain S-box-containing protein
MVHAHDASAASSEAEAAARGRRRARREAFTVAIATFLVAGAGIFGLWTASAAIIRQDYRDHLTNLAIAATQLIDPQLHRSLRDPSQQDSPEYQRAVEPLRRLRLSLPEVRYIYTMVRNEGVPRFVLDAADPGDHDGDGVDDQAKLWEIYEDVDGTTDAALGDGTTPGEAGATREPSVDKWGSWMTGMAPLVDADGVQFGILGVDIEASRYVMHLNRARMWAFMGLVPAAVLIGLFGIGFYRMRVGSLAARRAAAHAARVLTAEQQRLSSVVEGTNVGTWESTNDPHVPGRYLLTVDARWAAMLGRSPDELNPMTVATFFAMLVHPEDAPAANIAVERALQEEGHVLGMDMRMRHAAGHWVWTEVRGKVIQRDERGRAQRLVGTQMDVTARKAAELALQESERNFRSLFELSPVGICLCELPSGRYLQVNDSLSKSTGYSREELLRMTFWDITPPEWQEQDRRVNAGATDGGHFGPFEKEYRRKDGSRYPVLISGQQLRDPTGRLVGWAIVQDISERKAMEVELSDAAHRDRLTGLANRTLLMERLQDAIERVRDGRQARFAVLFLDFDRFKLINDAMGHDAGDALLREIASRLRSALGVQLGDEASERATLIARFGGDEFLVLLNELKDEAAAERAAWGLLAALNGAYSVHGREVYSSASIGIFTSSQGMDNAESVVRDADVAMYEAKRTGRARAVRFDDTMRTRITRYVAVDDNLRKALGTPEFTLVYQPIIDLDSRRIISVEALARWHHPELGDVSPAEFIPVAEESGLIAQLGQWVLREACHALASWQSRDPFNAPQTISVNLSRGELALGDRLVEQVQRALREATLPASCLRLEITERDVMHDPEGTLRLVHALRDSGVRIAMDDFGTGTSSLACLRDYPFDVIKIDQSFIRDVAANPQVLAVLHAVVELVENLGKTSVADGVENLQQVAILRSLGCHHAQGYYFSPPLDAQQVLAFMASPPDVIRLA